MASRFRMPVLLVSEDVGSFPSCWEAGMSLLVSSSLGIVSIGHMRSVIVSFVCVLSGSRRALWAVTFSSDSGPAADADRGF
jgi:hypothetical protein